MNVVPLRPLTFRTQLSYADAIALFMWGRNVVRLSGVRRGPRLRCYSSLTGAVSVSEREFLEAFLEVYPRDRWKGHESIGRVLACCNCI